MEVVKCPSCGRRNRVPKDAAGIPRCGNCHHALPWLVDADDDDFEEVADKASLPVLVDLWATWCGPCRRVSLALERLAEARAGLVKLVKVDIDRSPKIARRFAVQAVPTLILMNVGTVVVEQAGAAPEYILGKWLDEGLARIADMTTHDHEEGVRS